MIVAIRLGKDINKNKSFSLRRFREKEKKYLPVEVLEEDLIYGKSSGVVIQKFLLSFKM